MKKMDVSEIVNSPDAITIGQLFQILKRVKFTALLSTFAIFSSLLGGSYALGRVSQQKETAIMLHSPFSMRLELDNKKFDFQNLTLVEDPMLVPISKETIVLSLREIKSDFDIVPVGKIVARVDQEELSWPWSMFAGDMLNNDAHAQAEKMFNWNNHNGDMKYKESFVSEDTVNRFYSDGCILEYKVDTNRRSIPSTFKWIKSVH